MKNKYTRQELVAHNEDDVAAILSKSGNPSELDNLLVLVAQALDTAITEGDCYITIGKTRNSDALILTLHVNDVRSYATGACLVELCKAIDSLL